MSKEGSIFDGFDAIIGGPSGEGGSAKGVTSIGNSSSQFQSPIDHDDDIHGGNDSLDGIGGDALEGEEAALRAIQEKRSKLGKDDEGDDEIIDKNIDTDEPLDGEDEDEIIDKDLETIKVKEPKTSDSDEDGIDDGDMFGDAEADMVEYVQEKLFERLGLDDDETELKSFDDITEYIEKTIEERSKPEYSSKEIENLDQYVRSGGDVSSYIAQAYRSANVLDLDLDNADNQKRIVREDLRLKGVKEERIEKRIQRMEDTDILAEEAEDSLEALKEFSQAEQQRLLDEQVAYQKEAEKANKLFVKGIKEDLNKMKDVRGFPISKAEKNQLLDYMLKPTQSGMPQYHIDYKAKRANMIESAYFTMKGDKLIKKVENKATSKAAKKLKQRLADKGRRGVNQKPIQTKSSLNDTLGMFSKALM